MKTEEAIKLVTKFKGKDLKENLQKIKSEIIGKSKVDIPDYKELLEASLIVKKLSAQIHEVVHALGIIDCLPKILDSNEIIESLSLASGAEGDGIDLVTDKRIAEFKFANWQDAPGNGMRKRQVFADCVGLFLYETDKKKEIYVNGADRIEKYFNSKQAKWRNVISNKRNLKNRLEAYTIENNLIGESLFDIYSISNIKVVEIRDI